MRPSPLTSILFGNLLWLAWLPACGDGSTATATTGDTSTGEPATTSDATTSSPTTSPSTGDDPGETSSAGTSTTSSGGDTSTGDAIDSSGGDTSTGDTTGDAIDTDASSSGSSGGDEGLGQAAQDIVAELEAAVDGVLYLSESDYPWHVVAFADVAPVTAANLKDIIKDVYVQNPNEQQLVDRTIELHTFPWLMDPITVEQPWWDDGYYMQAEQYAPIRMIFETELENLQVFRLGEMQGNALMGAIDVYVLGETADGDVVGMWSVAVET